MKHSKQLRRRLKPEQLQRAIKALGVDDVQVRYSVPLMRWQVWQVRVAPIATLDKPSRHSGVLMWTIEEQADGAYRDPMVMDLERMKYSLENYKLLKRVGPDRYADMMDKRDVAREGRFSPDAENKVKWGARELADRLYREQKQTAINRRFER